MNGLEALQQIEQKLSECYGQDIAYDQETFDLFKVAGKELQALEIIESKGVNVHNLVVFVLEYGKSYDAYVEDFRYAHNYFDLGAELLTEDEYYLLHEVLLWKKD